MSATDPPAGYTFRPATLDDAPAIADLQNETNLAEVGFVWTSAAHIVDELTAPDRDPQDDLLLLADDGSVAGYLTLSWDAGSATAHQLAFVHPSLWGRGLSTWLLRTGEERARTKVDPARDEAAVIHVARWATNEAAGALFASLGYRYVRTFRTLRMELVDVAPVHLPEGVTIRTFDRDSDVHAVHETLTEAFADHWGSFAFSPFDEWVHESIEGQASGFDPDLWFVALDGGDFVGAVCARKDTPRDETIGQIDHLGVRRAWRNHGVGTALLLSAFRELSRRGVSTVELGVDSDSPTGARRLYESVGMRTAYAFEVWEKGLSSTPP